jgi:glycosyltransferase involved in cell wall biosynthesis
MKIFVLAVGDRRRASSRLRVWDHVDWLREQGHDVTCDYVMPPNIQSITIGVAWRIFSRWPLWAWQFICADRVLIQEALLLGPLLWVKRWGKTRRVVFDFSDPIDTIGSGLRNRMQRLGFKVMTSGADHVIVENASYLTSLGGRGIKATQFYGPVDVDRYQACAREQPQQEKPIVRIGWTGSPGTLSFIAPLFPVLDSLACSHQIELMLLGVNSVDYSFKNLTVHVCDWSESEEFHIVPSFDLGLFVLDGSENSKLRGAGKIFVYMAAGVPFVASDLGIAADLMRVSEVGFKVNTDTDWKAVLDRVISDKSVRLDMSIEGCKYAMRCMSYSVYRMRLIEVLDIALVSK